MIWQTDEVMTDGKTDGSYAFVPTTLVIELLPGTGRARGRRGTA